MVQQALSRPDTAAENQARRQDKHHGLLSGSQAPDLKSSTAEQDAGRPFEIVSEFSPAGDQPIAIPELSNGIVQGEWDQVLLGVTGSGKTFTIAHMIQEVRRPALILAPNKTLAAQLYGEMKTFFPNNAVEYFVSYYDYYTPEAYVPRSDTFIEKEASINEQIDRMRHSATRSLLERDDVIIVASVSCIYGLGSVESYSKMTMSIKKNNEYNREKIIKTFVDLQYKRNDQNFYRGTFRVRGDNLEIFPSHLEDRAWRISIFKDKIDSIVEFDPLTGNKLKDLDFIKIYANSHYITPKPTLEQAIKEIKSSIPEVVIGAGTVTTPYQFERAVEAGADFIVSPGHTKELLKLANESNTATLPGVSTPSEAMVAMDFGFNQLKLFPAEALGGINFLKAIKGPFPELKFCATGGITINNAYKYLSLSNVFCVGGSWLTPNRLIESKSWKDIELLALEASNLIKE